MKKLALKSLLNKLIHDKRNRRRLTLVSLLMLAYVGAMCGIFSYFHSEDVVANQLSAPLISLALYEPRWDNAGIYMADASEPGMQIPKNPYGYNDGETAMYMRIKMVVALNAPNLTDKALSDEQIAAGEIGQPEAAERLSAVIGALRLDRGTENTADDTAFIAIDEDFSVTGCNNPDFIVDKTNYGSGEDDDKCLVYYFYYTAGSEDGALKLVAPGGATAELFQYLQLPVYKKDYLGIFDQQYSITLTAEGIPAAEFDNISGEPKVSDFKERTGTDSQPAP